MVPWNTGTSARNNQQKERKNTVAVFADWATNFSYTSSAIDVAVRKTKRFVRKKRRIMLFNYSEAVAQCECTCRHEWAFTAFIHRSKLAIRELRYPWQHFEYQNDEAPFIQLSFIQIGEEWSSTYSRPENIWCPCFQMTSICELSFRTEFRVRAVCQLDDLTRGRSMEKQAAVSVFEMNSVWNAS